MPPFQNPPYIAVAHRARCFQHLLSEPLFFYLGERLLPLSQSAYFSSSPRYLLYGLSPTTAAQPISLHSTLVLPLILYELPSNSSYLARDSLRYTSYYFAFSFCRRPCCFSFSTKQLCTASTRLSRLAVDIIVTST